MIANEKKVDFYYMKLFHISFMLKGKQIIIALSDKKPFKVKNKDSFNSVKSFTLSNINKKNRFIETLLNKNPVQIYSTYYSKKHIKMSNLDDLLKHIKNKPGSENKETLPKSPSRKVETIDEGNCLIFDLRLSNCN